MVQAPRRHITVVDGCPISWLSWGAPTRRPVIFVHGGAAHAQWWSFTAPLLSEDHHVVAVDLSGHGDSGHRARYGFPQWAREVHAIAGLFTGAPAPIVVGHSMGGIVATMAAVRSAHRSTVRFGGLISVDSPLREPDATDVADTGAVLARRRYYPSRADAVRRFRPMPPQPVSAPQLVRHVAENSVVARSVAHNGTGWTWKFDGRVFARPAAGRPPDILPVLAEVPCPTGIVVGERSPILSLADRDRLRQLSRRRTAEAPLDVVMIAEGHHHLMFDRPMELVAAICALVGSWRSRC